MNIAAKEHQIVSNEQWVARRKVLLAEEKTWTRERDRLAAKRRELPWVRIEKEYKFAGAGGPVTLAELFDGRSQLIVYHFMFGPEWKAGCPTCSFLADHVDGARQHFEHRDVSFCAVSRTSLEKIEAYRKRMGWKFRWVSSLANDFNFDFKVSFTDEMRASGHVQYNFGDIGDPGIDELPGTSVFYKDSDGSIYRTYSSYARGGEVLLGAYGFLDLVPKGRDENGPRHDMGDWLKRHDEYGENGR